MGFSFLLYYFQVGIKLKNSKLTFEKYNDFLYKDDNEKYFKKNEEYKEKTTQEISDYCHKIVKENADKLPKY